jgi:MFS family permease
MNSTASDKPRLGLVGWMVLAIASIGFLFDTYVLLMTPLVGVPAISELLQLPPNNKEVTDWMGRMLWLTALSGGVFGLLGGWLIDRYGRKSVMAASILVYALSPCFAAFSTTLGTFVFFRCTMFVGVCVEFVAAITWLAELFPDKRQKEFALGFTQAFASLGGLFVTGIDYWISTHANELPALPIPEIFNNHATWRYTSLTGILPAIPIALMLPFVPESKVWRERRASGKLKRPSFWELFSPELCRTTLVTAALSACAYAAAFGALQLTTRNVVPGLPDLAENRRALKPLQEEAISLNQQLTTNALPAFRKAVADVPGLAELAAQRAKLRIRQRALRKEMENAGTADSRKAELKAQFGDSTNRFASLDIDLAKLTEGKPDVKKAVIDREKILKLLGDNREKQDPIEKPIKGRGNQIQTWQEAGGLAGRIVLAILLLVSIGKRTLLRVFQVPGLIIFPLTYFYFFSSAPDLFAFGIAAAGFMVVGQFSYFGEYLPKVFPVHLRGTGGSFATNVGGRMFGTSAAYVTTNLVAPHLSGTTFQQVAMAAGIVATSVFVIGFALSFMLPEGEALE